MSKETAAESFANLRNLKDRFAGALKAAEQPLIADVVLRAGWHPYRDGAGRVIFAEMIRRHRQPPRPTVPEVTQADVKALADELGIDADFEPTRRLQIE